MRRTLLIGAALLVVLALLANMAVRIWLGPEAIRGAIERQASSALGLPVRIGSAQVRVLPRFGLELRDVSVGEPARTRLDGASVAMGLGVILSRRVEGADVRLTGGFLDASMLAALAASGDDSASGEAAGAPIAIGSIRSFRLENIDVVAGAARIRTSLTASLDGDRLGVTNLTAALEGATLAGQGEVSSLDRREAHFDIRADTLPVDALAGALGGIAGGGTTNRTSPGAGTPSAYHVTAAVTAPVATIGGRRLDSFATRIEATPAALVFDPLTFEMDGGRVEARASLDPSAADPTIEIRGRASGLDVQRLQAAAGSGKGLTGRLDAQFALQIPQSAMPAVAGRARGTLELDVREGTMPGIRIIRQAVIRTANRARPAPDVAATDTFSRIDSSLTLQAGTVRVTSLAMKAADFDLTGTGVMALSSGRIALDVDLSLTEALSQQAGRDLYRYARDGRRIVVPATIGGTLSEPTASIDVGEAAGRALRNRLEEEARSILEGVIKRNKPDREP
jgi:uncharacterized protein involved in outer membrane biogenesis